MTFKKRKFQMTFCREQNGKRYYTVEDSTGEMVFVFRIFAEDDAKAIIWLLEQTYDAALADMKDQMFTGIKHARGQSL